MELEEWNMEKTKYFSFHWFMIRIVMEWLLWILFIFCGIDGMNISFHSLQMLKKKSYGINEINHLHYSILRTDNPITAYMCGYIIRNNIIIDNWLVYIQIWIGSNLVFNSDYNFKKSWWEFFFLFLW